MAHIYEGTLEEIIRRYGRELNGQRVRVTTLPVLPATKEKVFHEVATPEEWAKELRAWAASHDPNIPPLSDEAMSRESIYEGRGE
jgi:hypothetical protein